MKICEIRKNVAGKIDVSFENMLAEIDFCRFFPGFFFHLPLARFFQFGPFGQHFFGPGVPSVSALLIERQAFFLVHG